MSARSASSPGSPPASRYPVSSASASAVAVERRDEQAECGRREHHAGGEPEQRVEGQGTRAPKDEHGHATEPGDDQPKSVSTFSDEGG
jgi:hypothetical protein